MIHERRLSELEQRIELLATNPGEVRAPFTRLFRPVYRTLGWRPRLATDETVALLAKIREGDEDVERALDKAIGELEGNVGAIERACVVNGRVGLARAAWLRRLFEVTLRAAHAVERDTEVERRAVAAIEPARLLPPMGVRAADEAPVELEPDASRARDDRLVELQLASVDRLLDSAFDERAFLARKRRLLEAARQLLLECAAAMPLDAEAVEARRALVAREIVRVARLEAAGIAPGVAVLHQARTALARGDRERLNAALVALDDGARTAGDLEVALRTHVALSRIWRGRDPESEEARAASLVRSAEQALGRAMTERIRAKGGGTEVFAPALAVDGAFEVGGTLSPVRVTELETRLRTVAFPTPELLLQPARTVEDLPHAVISDPRSILLDLATGRLLTRKFVREDVIEHKRTRLIGEIRVYLLDGSTSMHGHRAKVRDGILVAELATMAQRFEEAHRYVRTTLFYRYFDTELGPVCRVADHASALSAIDDVLGAVREGGTNIENALLASLAQIRAARASDAALSRAQIVLVTDGQSPVREQAIDAARAGLDDVAIGVSVIALGEENPVLAALVAKQRARGERAFYHFIPDDALRTIVAGDIDRGAALHLPALAEDAARDPGEVRADLDREVGSLLEELADLDRRRDLEALEQADAEARVSRELGIDLDGAAARRDAAARDLRAVEQRFARWFPTPSSAPGARPEDDDDFDAVWVVLATIAEVVSLLGGAPVARKAEALDALERLLPDAALSPGRWERVLRENASALAPALAQLHAAVDPARH